MTNLKIRLKREVDNTYRIDIEEGLFQSIPQDLKSLNLGRKYVIIADSNVKKLYGEAGVYAYLGTKDMREIEQRVKDGDEFTTLIYDAMIYQICKEIGAMASVMNFDIDGIIITGGLAKDRILIGRISEKVHKIGSIYIYPGSNENEALAQSVLRVLQGVEKFMIWPVRVNKEEKR